MTGRYYADVQRFEDAEKLFNDLIAVYPKSRWASQARIAMPSILSHQGRKQEAIKAWQDVEDTTDDRQLKVSAAYNKGIYVMLQGPEHYSKALAIWKKIIEDNPNAPCTEAVQGMIDKVHVEIIKSVAEELLKEKL